jgi:hypothetical protein
MTWLAFVFALEMGFLPAGSFHLYEPMVQTVEPAAEYYADLGARAVLWDRLYVGGSVRTYFSDIRASYQFKPLSAAYLFEAGYSYGWLSTGWRHYCTHPVVALGGASFARLWEGGYEEVFVRVEGRIARRGE